MNILGIDPGFSSGGLVLIDSADDDRIIDAISVSGKMNVSKPPARVGNGAYAHDVMRARSQAQRMFDAVVEIKDKHGVDHIAIESFIDLKSLARKDKKGLMKQRWKTPLVLGVFDVLVQGAGFDTANGSVSWQNPAILSQFSQELGELKDRTASREDVVSGGSLLVNDHLQKAWAHAQWCSLRIE